MSKPFQNNAKNKTWKPNEKQLERQERVYRAFYDMRDVMTRSYREFNDRTLIDFLNDSQKRANGYVASRDDQGKEDWQANIFTQYTRNKVKAFVASVAKDVPRISLTAVNDQNQQSFMRAEVMESLVKASYVEKGNNPERVIFDDGWNGAINGITIKYDGYVRSIQKRKPILSYDPTTGEVKLGDEQEVVIDDKPFETNVLLQHFYIRNAFITDLQKQPDVIWVTQYDREDFDAEWGKYPNASTVPDFGELERDEQNTFFGEQIETRTDRRPIEVLRYFNKNKDEYVVYANGVELLTIPLIWGRRKKLYPFAKTIFEPFSNSAFFWGNSLPNILMGEQDVANSFLNAMIDKTYRSLNSPMLIDVQNRDAFQLEDEFVTGDTKIYVNNVSGVKPMPQDPISPAEFNMLEKVTRGIDQASVDALQQGFSGSGSTAREIVLANERADELKGLFYLMLKDLWLQKYILRIQNILIHYSDLRKVEMIVGGEKKKVFMSQFNLPNAELSDRRTGTLQVNVFERREALPSPQEIDVMETMGQLQGKNLEIVNITSTYLDDWEYVVQVESETFRQKNRALDMALATEKLQTVSQVFPEIFQANKEEFFRDLMRKFDDDPERYLQNVQEQPAVPEMAGQATGGEMGGALTEQIGAPAMQSLPRLSGTQ